MPDAMMGSKSAVSLQSLPTEVLFQIWCGLEVPDLRSFSCLCRADRDMMNDDYLAARYFQQTYGAQAFFWAVACPRRFTPQLFETLMRFGAPLPRNQVQSLCKAQFAETYDRAGRWGQAVPLLTVSAVIAEAAKRYGDDAMLHFDDERSLSFDTLDLYQPKVFEILQTGRYLPRGDDMQNYSYSRSNSNRLPAVLLRFPQLVEVAFRNGWHTSAADGAFMTEVLGRLSRGLMGAAVNRVAEQLDLVEQLYDTQQFAITEATVSETLMAMWNADRPEKVRTRHFGVQQSVSVGWLALDRLDKKGKLNPTTMVSTQVRKFLQKRFFDKHAHTYTSRVSVLQHLARQFTPTDPWSATPTLMAMLACSEVWHDADIVSQMQGIAVTQDDIFNLLVVNRCYDAKPLQLGRALVPDLDTAELVRQLLPHILCRSWRGFQLAALHAEVPGLAEMLAQELLRQKFRISDMPGQWRFGALRRRLFQLDEPGPKPLAISYEDRKSIRAALWRSHGINEPNDPRLTNFWKLNGHLPPGEAAQDVDDAFVCGKPPFGLKLRAPPSSEATAKDDAHQSSWFSMERPRVEDRYELDILPSCIRILDPGSPAANVAISHAVLAHACGTDPGLGWNSSARFSLMHWKLLSWLGSTPPSWMVDAILDGLPFSLEGQVQQPRQTDAWLLKAKAVPDASEHSWALDVVQAKNGAATRQSKPMGAELQSATSITISGAELSRNLEPTSNRGDEHAQAVLSFFVGDNYYKTELTVEQWETRYHDVDLWIKHLEGLRNLERKYVALETWLLSTLDLDASEKRGSHRSYAAHTRIGLTKPEPPPKEKVQPTLSAFHEVLEQTGKRTPLKRLKAHRLVLRWALKEFHDKDKVPNPGAADGDEDEQDEDEDEHSEDDDEDQDEHSEYGDEDDDEHSEDDDEDDDERSEYDDEDDDEQGYWTEVATVPVS